jgi:hypothetical protein
MLGDGWDEGSVYYSGSVSLSENNAQMTAQKFQDFVRNFKVNNTFPYR